MPDEAKTTSKELEVIRAEMNRLSIKINRRMKELEGMSEGYAIVLHGDPVIDTAARKLRRLHTKARAACSRLAHTDVVCRELRSVPKVLKQLDFFESCARALAYLEKTRFRAEEA